MSARQLLVACLLTGSGALAADPIVATNLLVQAVDGTPSGAYPNAAKHYFPQCVAVNFNLTRATRLSTLTFWGSSDAFQFTGLDNVRGFEVRFYTPAFTTPTLQFTLLRGSAIQETPTQRVNADGGLEYQFRVNVPGRLPAGSWWMHVGANLIDVNGDAWLWSPGARNGVRYTQYSGSAWSAWTSDSTLGAAYELRGTLACPSDIDDSGTIDLGDIALQLLDYGPCADCATDLDGNGLVDFGDIALALLDMGPCP